MNAVALALTLLLLNPVRLYFQPDQPILIRIDTQAVAVHRQQAPSHADAPLRLVLLGPQGQVRQSATLKTSPDQPTLEVDLATLFPAPDGSGAPSLLWNGQTHFVQLALGDQAIGTPLVVVPLRPPGRAGASPNALRIYPETMVKMETSLGDLLIRLDPQAAPNTTLQFSQLVQGGFYTQVIFHRIIPRFVIQGGDPTGTGTGGPGFFIDLEPSTKPHAKGTVSMARQGNDINSSGSQFFICLSREACQALDGKYTAFGDVVLGMDVVDRLAAVRTGAQDRPHDPPVIRQATLVLAPARPLDTAPTMVGTLSDVQPLETPAAAPAEPPAHAKEAIKLLQGGE